MLLYYMDKTRDGTGPGLELCFPCNNSRGCSLDVKQYLKTAWIGSGSKVPLIVCSVWGNLLHPKIEFTDLS